MPTCYETRKQRVYYSAAPGPPRLSTTKVVALFLSINFFLPFFCRHDACQTSRRRFTCSDTSPLCLGLRNWRLIAAIFHFDQFADRRGSEAHLEASAGMAYYEQVQLEVGPVSQPLAFSSLFSFFRSSLCAGHGL